MNELLNAWALVACGLLYVADKHAKHYWAHLQRARDVSEQERLAKLEREVQLLVQAQNLRGLKQ